MTCIIKDYDTSYEEFCQCGEFMERTGWLFYNKLDDFHQFYWSVKLTNTTFELSYNIYLGIEVFINDSSALTPEECRVLRTLTENLYDLVNV